MLTATPGNHEIGIVIADDHPPLREGIRMRLERTPDIRVIGEAASGPELFAALRQGRSPDVLLLDIRMPDFQILQAIPELRAEFPDMGILVVSAHDDPRHIKQLMEAGVDGYVVKQEDMSVYVAAIRRVASGQTYFSQRVLSTTLEANESPVPSPRELEILTFVARDATTNDIANRLGLSPRTVETHIKRAFLKLGVSSRAAAVAKAVALGYIDAID